MELQYQRENTCTDQLVDLATIFVERISKQNSFDLSQLISDGMIMTHMTKDVFQCFKRTMNDVMVKDRLFSLLQRGD